MGCHTRSNRKLLEELYERIAGTDSERSVGHVLETALQRKNPQCISAANPALPWRKREMLPSFLYAVLHLNKIPLSLITEAFSQQPH